MHCVVIGASGHVGGFWHLRSVTGAEPHTTTSYCRQYWLDYMAVNSRTLVADFLQAGDSCLAPFNSLLYAEISQRPRFA